MIRAYRPLPLAILAWTLAVHAHAQVAPAVDLAEPQLAPPVAALPPLVAAPATPENMVHEAIERWEQANDVRVTAVVASPLVRETEWQLKRAPKNIDAGPAVDKAVWAYLSGTAKYRPGLKQALHNATSEDGLEEVIVTGAPAYSRPSAVNPFILIVRLFMVTPVSSPWDLRLLADRHATRVKIGGVEGDRRANDIYLVSGETISVELQTARGPCIRSVRKSGDKTANCPL